MLTFKAILSNSPASNQDTNDVEISEDFEEIEIELEDLILLLTDSEDNNDSINNDGGHTLIWWEGRNTPQVVPSGENAVERARKKGSAGSKGKVKKSRKATEEEEKAIRAGKWLRTRSNGSTNSSSGSFKFRKHLKSKAKGNDVGV